MTGDDTRTLRDKLAETMRRTHGSASLGRYWHDLADALLPVIEADRRNYAAQRLDEAADDPDTRLYGPGHLRVRAAALRGQQP